MAKVVRKFSGYMDTFDVASGTVDTGWEPGNIATLDTNGELALYTGSGSTYPIGFIIDDEDELAQPPEGYKVTVMHGNGRLQIDAEDASDANNVFVGIGSFVPGQLVYATTTGKVTPHYNATENQYSGSVAVGKCVEAPSADNGYVLDLISLL